MTKGRTISAAIVDRSEIIGGARAVWQYRWSRQVSEATSAGLPDGFPTSMQKDAFRYFFEIGVALRIDLIEDAPGEVAVYIRRFAEWMARGIRGGVAQTLSADTLARRHMGPLNLILLS